MLATRPQADASPAASQITVTFSAPRLVALDQFRGYTIAGMFLVNFCGSFAASPRLLDHHNTYCSYADTIMPQFFFCMGFAMRLSLLRRAARGSWQAAVRHALGRALALALIGIIVYQLDGNYRTWAELSQLSFSNFIQASFHSSPFQTLVHLAVTGVWVLPVILLGPGARIAWLLASAALHLALSRAFYFDWALTHGAIDGGVLGFLSWSIPVLLGSLAYDAVQGATSGRSPLPRLVGWGCVFMLIGYALSCGSALGQGGSGPWRWFAAPPFMEPRHLRDVWTMSQKTGAISYQIFAAGFSLALFCVFAWAVDLRGWKLALFTTLGSNALVAYLIHSRVADAVNPFAPQDSPGWWVTFTFLLFFAICWLLLRGLERQKIFLKL